LILKRQDKLEILKIVFIYSFFGGAWIYLSDSFVGLFVKDPKTITQIAIFKGVFFIITTAVLLYALIVRRMKEIRKSEYLLQKSEQRFKQISENAEEIIWEMTTDGMFTYVSPVVERVLGYKPEELVNKKYYYDLFEPRIAEDLKNIVSNLAEKREVLKRFSTTSIHKNGKSVVLEINASPIINSSGEVTGYGGVDIDITERKNAETALKESEEKYRTLIQTSPDAILMFSLNGDIQLVNSEAVKMHGYSGEDEMVKLNADSLIAPEETKRFYGNLNKVINSGRSVYEEYLFVKKEGGRFYAGVNLSIVFNADKKPVAVIGVARDISERKSNEIELEKYRMKLEELVSERTKELEEVNLRLQKEILKQKDAEEKVVIALEKEKEVNAMKSEFISTASHEFRTPLATIFSSTELIERYWKKQDEVKLYEHTGRIKSAIKYLTGLMDDVLTISKSETKKIIYNTEKCDLVKLCNSIIEEIKALLSEKHHLDIDIQLGGGIYYADEKLIKLILSNLLSNAIKFSADGGRIGFIARTMREEIIFEVSDEGIGIPAEDQKRIFEPFDRGSNIGVIRGTGLGMSIVKRSLDLLGGTIRLESGVGKGTKFVVSIPIIQNM
jgi:PAS domain S-box-containing protein